MTSLVDPGDLRAAAEALSETIFHRLSLGLEPPETIGDIRTHDDLLAFAADAMFRAADEIERLRAAPEGGDLA